jgi:hypothetical protein
MKRITHCSNRSRRAAVLPLVTVCLLVLLGFVAFAVDLGYVYCSRAEMQRTADASALAGASALMQGEDIAIDRAIEGANLNDVARTAVADDEIEPIVGYWEWYTREFYPNYWEIPVKPNAVRAIGTRMGMPLFFAPVIGSDHTDVIEDAIALSGSGKCAGVWGLQGITVRGDVYTDSYNSNEGGYGEGPVYPNGDLCSCQDMTIRGGVDIHGDVSYGDGYDMTVSGGSNEIWGVVDTFTCGPYAPGFDIEAASLSNDNGLIGTTDAGRDPFPHGAGELVLMEDDNLTLVPGTYYFESVRMTGQSTLTVTGPTMIYVAGEATFAGGGILNLTEDPAELTVYCTGSDAAFSGTSGLYASVIAPYTDIQIVGDVDFYGTMLGQTLTMTGTFNLHVDEEVVFDLFGEMATDPVLVE